MKQLRLWCVLLFAWFFALYNIERLHKPINLASFVYVLAAVAALAVILIPRLQRLSLGWLLALPLPVFFLLKVLLNYPLAGTSLPNTVTEVCAIWLSIVLARQIGRGLEEFRLAVLETMTGRLTSTSQPFDNGQEAIHREIRRARLYHRPLSLLAIAPTPVSLDATLHRFVCELQQETVSQYVSGRLAEFLGQEMNGYDVITHRNGHFVTLLAETGREDAVQLAHRLKAAVKEHLGLDLAVGLSVFPEEEFTLVGLLERAEEEMHSGGLHLEHAHEGNGHAKHGSETDNGSVARVPR